MLALISVLNESNILREDIPRKFTTREELLSYAPEQSDGYFQVPKLLIRGGKPWITLL